jgi:hydrogenase 3 maturation protease
MRNLLLGIGNPLRRDDGAGNYVASFFRAPGWSVADCGTAPENFTGLVRRQHPGLLVLVDAADMGLAPGEYAVIPRERIRDVGIGTHQLPLDFLIGFIEECAGKIIVIGIQPKLVETGEGLSPEVQEGADRLIRVLQRGRIREIPVLGEGPES